MFALMLGQSEREGAAQMLEQPVDEAAAELVTVLAARAKAALSVTKTLVPSSQTTATHSAAASSTSSNSPV